MRILILGSRRRWRIEQCFARAFERAGHQALVLDDRLLARTIGRPATQRWVRFRAARFRPDFVLLSKCLGLELDTVASLVKDRQNAMWYSDAQWFTHVHARTDIAHIAAVARFADRLWLPAFVDEWRAMGFDARHLPFAGDREIVPADGDPALATDVAFLGTGYDPARARFLVELAKAVRVRVWGLGWSRWSDQLDWAGHPVEGREFAAVCSSAALTLGITAAAARGNPFYTDRMFITILAGGCYLGEGGRDAGRMLADGEHCIWYDSLDDCIVRAKQYLADSGARQRIRAAGERFVREHHTYDQRVPHFLSGAPYVAPL
ncbi:MAG: glycosyltransferase [Gemmatimonadaceae bacterium]